MARRKLLKGVANGIADKFVSRNNDMNGWWALGVLYALASHHQTRFYTLDLLTGQSVPADADSQRTAEPFSEFLRGQLVNLGLTDDMVSEAVVHVEFDCPDVRKPNHGWGEPFRCRVEITDDLSITRVAERTGACGSDPKISQRSIRRYATPPSGILAKLD